MLAGYEWGLKRVLTYQFLTLCVFLGMMVVTGGLYVEIPKKFFPKQDTGSISDSAEGAQDISSAAMWNHLADLDELDVWAPKLVAKLQSLPQLADVTSDQQANAASATLIIDRDRTARFGIQPALIDATIYAAIGQRDVAQYFTQLNSYHVVLEVGPALQTDPRLFDKLYLTSPTTGQQVPSVVLRAC